jgi:hypothetical protein
LQLTAPESLGVPVGIDQSRSRIPLPCVPSLSVGVFAR